jgi:hypothetical protein
MEPRSAATRVPDPDAAEFIRFCYRRRRVGWPELYDEMCAVAARGLFRGFGADELAAHGIGFGLFDMPALAAMSSGIVAQEQALRRPMTVVITPEIVPSLDQDLAVVPDIASTTGADAQDAAIATATADATDLPSRSDRTLRFAALPAGA